MMMPPHNNNNNRRLESFEEEPEDFTNECDDDSVVTTEEMLGKERVSIATSESKAVWYSRLALIAVLVLVAASVSFAVFYTNRANEQEDFETQYQDHARKIVSAFQSNAARRLKAMDSMAFGISSYAVDTNSSWPNVTIPDFEQRAQFSLDLADVISITLLPIVTNQTRLGWEEYSFQNQGWLTEGLEIQAIQAQAAEAADTADEEESLALLDEIASNSDDLQISPKIIRIEGTGSVNETGPGPFVPWWQFAPAFPFSTVVNYNTLSHPTRIHQLQTIMNTSQTLVSKAWDYRDTEDPETVGRKAVLNLFLNRWREGGSNYEDGPVSDVYVPIFDQVDPLQAHKKQMVAMLTAYVYWQVYFENILPDNAEGIMAILENQCGGDLHQSFTYRINGKKAEYVGQGDLHDARYNHLEISTGYPAFLQGADATLDNLMDGQCLYNVRVYPSREFQDRYTTATPWVFTLIIVAVFLFTSLAFVAYDRFVEERQRVVMKTAVQSTEVVNTLFPEAVRSRLYEENANQNNSSGSGGNMKAMMGQVASGEFDEEGNVIPTSITHNSAIADVYEECTVLFADIAGFTKWSDGKEPTQVFHLLEAVYGTFDRTARKRNVFKIETIGDCYLAVTGLPNPQKDHAMIMTKFAAECLTKMNQLIHSKLVNTLGEDVTSLQMRFGLNSGKVTAGVLRGERARFQLFGDTVNTAARMESTGIPGKIHASMSTANLLMAAGKSNWILAREGGVEAKGKGMLKTFWLQPILDRPTSVSTFHTASLDTSSTTPPSPAVLLDLEQGREGVNSLASRHDQDSLTTCHTGQNHEPDRWTWGETISQELGVRTDIEI
ncbi:Receptor-type guanylate cyclase gcy [Seminavis robusta]|uniref:Receptor-type guanylate cyclase gcy n=1 Tax=Seminavis robusta TaxID=568900 RepID=A0A9N8DBA9_9STRA|nr:Receptor-type guanylate cyclase gcy [Seminavis robusta]|eukprot:Sro43_g026230.1 Receptor-type guanylate cyclase gcy (835) ;mRNA; r:86547-89485